jgi:hypothetical protein
MQTPCKGGTNDVEVATDHPSRDGMVVNTAMGTTPPVET